MFTIGVFGFIVDEKIGCYYVIEPTKLVEFTWWRIRKRRNY
ncbi:hypothetical protein [Clostridium neuense]